VKVSPISELVNVTVKGLLFETVLEGTVIQDEEALKLSPEVPIPKTENWT